MPGLESHQSNSTTKMLLMGNSGAGKTGALASLAQAGYNLRIFDLDNGIDILKDLLLRQGSTYGGEAAARVKYQTLTDPMKSVGGRLVPGRVTVWQRLSQQLTHWKVLGPIVDGKAEVQEDLGPVATWTPQEVLVIDSLSMAGKAAMYSGMAMNNKIGQKPAWPEWADAQAILEPLLEMLYDEGVKCNVIINTHLHDVAKMNEPSRILPNTGTGRALEPRVGRYFNTILLVKKEGRSHKILTETSDPIDLKTPAPGRVKKAYSLESGLAEFFADIRKRD